MPDEDSREPAAAFGSFIQDVVQTHGQFWLDTAEKLAQDNYTVQEWTKDATTAWGIVLRDTVRFASLWTRQVGEPPSEPV